MSPNPPRRGRPTKPVHDDEGRTIVGLSAVAVRKSGKVTHHRFYATYSKPRKYFGSDRKEAIRVYYLWDAHQRGERVLVEEEPQPTTPYFRKIYKSLLPDRKSPEYIKKQHDIPADLFWTKVREHLLTPKGRKLVAQKTGIKAIEYLEELTPPPPTLTIQQAGEQYHDAKCNSINPKQLANSKTFWAEFCDFISVTLISDLAHDIFQTYANHIRNEQIKISPKTGKPRGDSYSRNRFETIKTILNYAHASRKISSDLHQTLRQEWKLPLEKIAQPRGKKYILKSTEFDVMLTHADDFMRAVLLMGMNCCFYPQDFGLTWDRIDLDEKTLVYPRKKMNANGKRGTVRVAVLWDATVEALRKLPDHTPYPFTTRGNKAVHPSTIYDRFVALRDKAGINKNKRPLRPEDLRNSGGTIAARNAPTAQYKVLMGHSLGGEDEGYIEGNPWFVADACKAIEKHYFGVKKAK